MGNTDSSIESAHPTVRSSMRHKNRESPASLPKQPKPDHNEIERRFNQVLVSIVPMLCYLVSTGRSVSIVFFQQPVVICELSTVDSNFKRIYGNISNLSSMKVMPN